jgi:hypothetical protein
MPFAGNRTVREKTDSRGISGEGDRQTAPYHTDPTGGKLSVKPLPDIRAFATIRRFTPFFPHFYPVRLPPVQTVAAVCHPQIGACTLGGIAPHQRKGRSIPERKEFPGKPGACGASALMDLHTKETPRSQEIPKLLPAVRRIRFTIPGSFLSSEHSERMHRPCSGNL